MVQYDYGLVVASWLAAPPPIDGVDERLADDVRRLRRDDRHLLPIRCCSLELGAFLRDAG